MGWGRYRMTDKERSDESERLCSEDSDEDYERGRRTRASSSTKQKKRRKDPSHETVSLSGSVFADERSERHRKSASTKATSELRKKNRKRDEKWYKKPQTSIRWGMMCFSIVVTVYVFDFISILRERSARRNSSTSRASGSFNQYVEDGNNAGGGNGNQTERLGSNSSRAESENLTPRLESERAQADIQPKFPPSDQPQGANSEHSSGLHGSKNNDPVPNPHSYAGPSSGARGDTEFQAKTMDDTQQNERSSTDEALHVKGSTGRLDIEEIKSYYKKLSQSYLSTFRTGIHRHMFFDVLRRRTYGLTPPGANKGVQSILFQIIDSRVFIMDPYEVPRNTKPFYRSRINEIIWLLSRLAKSGRIKNTEFLVSIHDCVQTVNKPHSYRGATYQESVPAFTIVTCNFSDNIPFPMWDGGAQRGGGFEKWNERMEEFASNKKPWSEKEELAVFRGGNRPSMYFHNKSDADVHCDNVGRSKLVHLASKHPSFLDVSIGGTCGGVHMMLNRMNEIDQQKYKYVLYAEGNCFWADRLNKQIFGSSLIVKQETPCRQFWEPLLAPMTHYLPTDFFFDNLIEQLEWARSNDEKAKEMVKNANEFALNFLTLTGIEAYVEVLLSEYTSLLVEPDVKLENGAIDVTDKQV